MTKSGNVARRVNNLNIYILRRNKLRQRTFSRIVKSIIYAMAAFCTILTVMLVIYILVKGIPNIDKGLFAWQYTSDNASIIPALINTVIVLFMSLLIGGSLGILSSIYMAEYATKNSIFVKVFRECISTLQAVPSIIYGLAGYMIFCEALKWQFSLISGSCTMAAMILPTVLRCSEEAIVSQDPTLKQAAFALGANHLYTLVHVTLPAAKEGIISGLILATGRVTAESAALIYTAGTVSRAAHSLTDSGRTLAVHLYSLWCEGLKVEKAQAVAACLLVLCAFLCALARLITKGKLTR